MSGNHHTLESGTRIDCYELGRVLGVGGFGVTYKGFDHTLSCDVAIKEYLPSGVALRTGDGVTVVPKSDQDQELYSYGLERFLDEARILAKFRAPSIMRVSRFLEGNGTAYLVMDYEDGQPLNQFLRNNGTLTEDYLLTILVPLLEGLRDVHAAGYLHRDIKPGNIYLRQDGQPVLLDFGAARQAVGSQTQAVTSMVTPGYAPIEQYNTTGKQGPWTDFYGLGATLYRCISNQNPAGAPDRMMALQAGDPDPLTPALDLGQDHYSPEILAIIDWMLMPNIADRPQDVGQILAALPEGAMSTVTVATARTGTRTTGQGASDAVSLNSSTHWRAADLESIARDLAKHVGPMARMLVKEASTNSHNLKELYARLSIAIDSDTAREAFMKTARHYHEPEGARTGAVREAISRPSRRSGPSRLTGKRPVTDAIVKQAEQKLASHVGPLAKMLVRRASDATNDAHEFVRLLAQEIDSEAARKAFIESIKI